VTVASTAACGTAYGATNDTKIDFEPTSPPRTLIFPNDQSLGFLRLSPRMQSASKASRDRMLQARGRVQVPADYFVTFEAGQNFFKKPDLIAKLPANAFDSMILHMFSMDDSEDGFCDRALASIGHLTGLRVLDLDKSEISDEGMKKIVPLVNLELISAFLTPLRGTFLKDTQSLKKLRILELESVGADENAMSFLSRYPGLRCLKMGHAHLSDKAVQNICSCTWLEDLSLAKNPAVDDKVIPYLKKLKNLRALNLNGTAITAEGVMALKDLKLTKLFLPSRKWPADVQAQIQKKLPKTVFDVGYVGGKVDEDTKAIFSPLTR
jgi:hypothetical protein